MRAEVLCSVQDCDRPVADQARCCSHCAWKLEKALGNVHAYAEELDIVLSRQARYEEHSERTNGNLVYPLFFDPRASEVGWVLQNTLTTWVKLIAEERGREIPGDGEEPTLTDLANWLLGHVEWIRHHKAGHEAVEEITTAVYETARVIDRPSNRTTFAIGPCPEFECAGEVRVFIPAREDRPAFMVCSVCEARWDSVQFLNAGKRIVSTAADRIRPYIDTAAAATALGVSDRTIRRWCVQGSLTNHGTPAQILLDLAEIEAIRTRRDEESSA